MGISGVAILFWFITSLQPLGSRRPWQNEDGAQPDLRDSDIGPQHLRIQANSPSCYRVSVGCQGLVRHAGVLGVSSNWADGWESSFWRFSLSSGIQKTCLSA